MTNHILDSSDAKSSAKAYAAQAGQSATAAKASETAAKQSETNAAVFTDAAKLSETNAKDSETVAVQKAFAAIAAATAAKASEASAEKSADAATQKASEAEDFKTAAAANALSAQQYSGKPPKPQNGTWWIWDAAQQKYIDTAIRCELVGPTGNGIQDIQLTSGDHTPGTTDIYTVTMTDGRTTPISVYNGRNGTGTGDVLGIDFDLVLPASGWVDGELTIADNRLLASATYKYFIDADEASREEYLDCEVQAKDITTTGFITFKSDTDPTTDLTVNIVRLELSAKGTT